MEKTLPLEESSISDIYLEGNETVTYKIPIYQRNYAWGDDEITALIKDVHDAFCKEGQPPYYIGTLVTYKRGDYEYEVIDGQQRLTTIYIILKALGVDGLRNKLTYSAREVSASTIEKLPDFGEVFDTGIRNGYDYAKNAIDDNVAQEEKEAFKSYFLHGVRIIHYNVPKDVDLNHYFEVMNSRGEQLEKHEIVKSNLGQYLSDKTDLATFSRIWEACTEMSAYVQQMFPDTTVFGNNLSGFRIGRFEEVPGQDVSEGKDSILHLMQGAVAKNDGAKANVSQDDRFQPIIDFPNFLLIVLKLTLMRCSDSFKPTDFILDDKELLGEFTSALSTAKDKEAFAKLFAFNLLKAKYLLDNYVVHHANIKEQAGNNPWQLQYYCQEGGKRYPKNLSDQSYVQEELVHLLSMFEVSFTARQRKNYLFYCLYHLFDDMDVNNYLRFVRRLADKYFHDVYLNAECINERNQPIPNAFDKVILNERKLDVDSHNSTSPEVFEGIYKQGNSDIPLFVFNYTDYKIWKRYADELRGNEVRKGSERRTRFFEKLGCSDFELEAFNSFYFSRTRRSLEHYYPRAKAVRDDEASKEVLGVSQINCFGNFAMIGAEANSSGSNWDPKTKLYHYTDGKSDPISVASLKFKVMMQACQDNIDAISKGTLTRAKGMEWNADDIRLHQRKMLGIVFDR